MDYSSPQDHPLHQAQQILAGEVHPGKPDSAADNYAKTLLEDERRKDPIASPEDLHARATANAAGRIALTDLDKKAL